MAGRNKTAEDDKIIAAIEEYFAEHGYSPSAREIGRMTGLKSPSNIMRRLRMLRESGVLTFDDRVPRSIVLKDRNV